MSALRKPVTRVEGEKRAELLQHLGIGAGEYQPITKPQLEALMRPDQTERIRVWACLLLHTMGYRDSRGRQGGRLAVRRLNGKNIPISPSDICGDLEKSGGKVFVQNIWRALTELEELGLARRTGKSKGKVRIFVYARPLDPNILIRSDNNIASESPQLALSMALRREIVKCASEIFSVPQILLRSDTKDLLLEAAKTLLKRIETEWKAVLLLIESERPIIIDFHKEDHIDGEGIVVVENRSTVVETTTTTEQAPAGAGNGSKPNPIQKAREVLTPYCPVAPDSQILRDTLAQLPANDGVTIDAFGRFVKTKRFRSNGLLPRLAQQFTEAYHPPEGPTCLSCNGKPSKREEIKNTLDLLHGLPSHLQADEWRAQIEAWRTSDPALVAQLEREVRREG